MYTPPFVSISSPELQRATETPPASAATILLQPTYVIDFSVIFLVAVLYVVVLFMICKRREL